MNNLKKKNTFFQIQCAKFIVLLLQYIRMPAKVILSADIQSIAHEK